MFFDWADEAEIDLVILQPLHDVVGRADHDMQLDIGVFAADARQERRRHVNGCGIDNSDPDLAHRIAGNRTQHLGRQIDIAQDPHKLTIVICLSWLVRLSRRSLQQALSSFSGD